MLTIDVSRAKLVGPALYQAFATKGIFGRKDMPEDLCPDGIECGSYEHLMFLTLTVALDYQRDSEALWASSRRTYEDPTTRYLYFPDKVVKSSDTKIVADMRKYRLSKKPEKDAMIWTRLSQTFHDRFGSSPENLLREASYNGPQIIKLLGSREYGAGFPYLKGAKIAPLWVRMLKDNGDQNIVHIERVLLPVDRHIAAASVMTGCIRIDYTKAPSFEEIRTAVQEVWQRACEGTPFYALQFDEPLWHLNRSGCSKVMSFPCLRKSQCPVAEYCTEQRDMDKLRRICSYTLRRQHV